MTTNEPPEGSVVEQRRPELRTARRRRGRPRSHALDQSILATTLELLCQPGYGRLTMEQFAVRAKVARSSARRRRSLWPIRSGPQASTRLPIRIVLAVVLVGAIQRWWVAAHPIGTLTSDGSVIGLMALRLLHHGQLTAYMWGQSYGGSLEAVLTAAVFVVAGAGTSQLVATTALSSGLCAIALWRIGRRIVGEWAAQIGALAFWVWPASFLWRCLKPGGTYMVGLAIALCAVGALVRIRQGDEGWRRCGVAGLWCGLALWSSPMSLELLIPVALWLIPAVRRLGRRMLAIAAGAIVGGLPILVFGATHDWTNLHMPGTARTF